jgi:Ca2+-binding RTX toxin-like protein
MIVLGITAAAAFAQDAIITGTDGPDLLTGTPAAESIYGRAGNDTINGAGGDDELDGGPGADVLNGGEGSDSVAYADSAAVSVTLDGVANDGVAGEGDNVGADVEDIFGADGNDKLDGNAAANTIDGGAGDDRISGGHGKDAIFGGDGDDLVDARDGEVDRVECGAGKDTVKADRKDIVSKDCGTPDYPPTTITPGLTLNYSKNSLIVSSLVSGSRVVVACARGCHPPRSPNNAFFNKKKIKLNSNQVYKTQLPRGIAGATIELGVTAPGASGKCVRYKVGRIVRRNGLKQFKSLRPLKGVACTTVARS